MKALNRTGNRKTIRLMTSQLCCLKVSNEICVILASVMGGGHKRPPGLLMLWSWGGGLSTSTFSRFRGFSENGLRLVIFIKFPPGLAELLIVFVLDFSYFNVITFLFSFNLKSFPNIFRCVRNNAKLVSFLFSRGRR